MVVVPEGSFTMGSPASEPGRYDDEGPQHVVKIARRFAVGKFDVTKDEFAAFVRELGTTRVEMLVFNKDKREDSGILARSGLFADGLGSGGLT